MIIAYNYTNSMFKIKFIVGCLLFFLILNIIINCLILNIDLKKDLSLRYKSNKWFFVDYIFKIASYVICAILIGMNIVVMNNCINYYYQKDFFENKKQYDYVKIIVDSNNIYNDNNEINGKYYNDFKNNSLQYTDLSNELNFNLSTVWINENTFELLGQQYNEFNSIKGEYIDSEQLIILSNDNLEIEDKNTIENIASIHMNKFNNVEYVKYETNIILMAINSNIENAHSKIYQNPIILYSKNDTPVQAFMYNVLYNTTNDQDQEFIESNIFNNYKFIKTNILEDYNYKLSMQLRLLKLTATLSLFLLLLEILFIMFIIRKEYITNSTELFLKKILGYSLIKSNIKLLFSTIISIAISISILFIINYIFDLDMIIQMSISIMILSIIEILIILLYARYMDKANLYTIIKGKSI